MKDIFFIKRYSDFYKIVLGFLAIGLFIVSPFVIGFGGAYIEEIIRGYPSNEGNSFFGALPWFCLLTIPIGLGLAVAWLALSLYNVLDFLKKKKTNPE